jgi:hypothetical protein
MEGVCLFLFACLFVCLFVLFCTRHVSVDDCAVRTGGGNIHVASSRPPSPSAFRMVCGEGKGEEEREKRCFVVVFIFVFFCIPYAGKVGEEKQERFIENSQQFSWVVVDKKSRGSEVKRIVVYGGKIYLGY